MLTYDDIPDRRRTVALAFNGYVDLERMPILILVDVGVRRQLRQR